VLRLVLWLLALASVAPAQARTRVLLVDLDDVGYDLLEATDTPTLDRLSREGRRFTRFHASPLCSPTRARGLLGAYGSRPEIALGTIIRRGSRYTLPLDAFVPLPRLLAAHDRSAVKVGKWHLCPDADLTHPTRAGFAHYAGVIGNPSGGSGGDNYFNFPKVVDGVETRTRQRYLTSDETDDALRFVRAGHDLVWLSYHAIHKPFHQPPAEVFSAGVALRTDLEHVRAMLGALDRELGRLLDAALAEGYTVLVVSDNGSPEEVGGGKGQLTPAGVIVPAWAIGPGVTPGVDDAPVDWVDLYATIAALLGVPREGADQGPDSVSFAHRLRGEDGPGRRYLYADRWKPNGKDPRALPEGKLWARVLRDERWTLVVDEGAEGRRLYDHSEDPNETRDLLAGELSDRAAAALARMLAELGLE